MCEYIIYPCALFNFNSSFNLFPAVLLLQGSFNRTGLVISSKLPRLSDMYTLTIASADPHSKSSSEPVHFTKSVTKW